MARRSSRACVSNSASIAACRLGALGTRLREVRGAARPRVQPFAVDRLHVADLRAARAAVPSLERRERREPGGAPALRLVGLKSPHERAVRGGGRIGLVALVVHHRGAPARAHDANDLVERLAGIEPVERLERRREVDARFVQTRRLRRPVDPLDAVARLARRRASRRSARRRVPARRARRGRATRCRSPRRDRRRRRRAGRRDRRAALRSRPPGYDGRPATYAPARPVKRSVKLTSARPRARRTDTSSSRCRRGTARDRTSRSARGSRRRAGRRRSAPAAGAGCGRTTRPGRSCRPSR